MKKSPKKITENSKLSIYLNVFYCYTRFVRLIENIFRHHSKFLQRLLVFIILCN